MALVSSLFSWVRGDGDSPKFSASLASSLEACEREQERIACEMERILHAYNERSIAIARRLLLARKEGIRKKELDALVEEQEKLTFVIRRLQASERSLRDLEHEYREWRARAREGGEDEVKILRRAEIVASELRLRGREVIDPEKEPSYEGSAKDVNPFEDLAIEDESIPDTDTDIDTAPIFQDEGPIHASLPGLLEEVDTATSEAYRMLRSPDRYDAATIASALADLRRHHGNLRMHDRREGIRRIRVTGFLEG